MNDWKMFRNEQPQVGKSVLIWRSNKKHLCFNVAKLESKNGMMIWRSSSGNALKIEEKDFWYEFPALNVTETYN